MSCVDIFVLDDLLKITKLKLIIYINESYMSLYALIIYGMKE